MNPAQGQLPGQGQGSGQGAQSPSQQPQQAAGVTQGQGQNQNQGQTPNLNQSGVYQPAQIRALNILSDEEKNKYIAGLEGLWAKIKSSPNGSNEYKQASEKIWNFSKMLQNKINGRQAQIRAHQQSMQQQQAQQAQQAQQQAQQTQQSQQQPQQMPQQPQQQRPQAQNQQPRQQAAPQQQGQQPQQPQQPQPPRPQAAAQKPQNQNQGQQQTAQNGATPNQNQAPGQQPQQANNQPAKLPENIMNHLRQLKIKGLPEFDNKPAAEQQKHINDLRTRYGRALMSVDLAKNRLRAIDSTTQKRSQEGKPFTEEEMKRVNEQKAQQQKIHHDASKWIEGFRRQHVISDDSNNAQSANQNAQAGNTGAAAPAGQQAGAANRVSPPNQNTAAQQAQAQLQAQQRPQLANNGGQNQQAGQAGRGQAPNAQAPQTANTGGPGRALSHQAAISLANQRAANTANNAQAQAQQGASQSQAAGTPTSAGGAPAANAQQPAPQQQQQQAQQPQQPPSQQQTPVQQQQQQPPPQQGHPHAHPSQAQTQMHSKMPIPKVLPEKATGTPQPVQTGGGVKGSRPTMNQGTGTMGSSMHQPAIQKIPAYNNEAEGDHVLSKKKLDELVRQVCGGSSDSQEGNLLAPDVEENVLNMADSFVDNVLHAASRNAKERGSKMLEIRDIQLVLERTYNIRVPGYSSDELRTVRKVQPTTGWIAKMSAVQAAKVMPGKGE